MKSIGEIDRNLAVSNVIGDASVEWHSAKETPIRIHGLYRPQSDGAFCRLPREVAAATNPGVQALCEHTAGGRARFITDSPYVAIHAEVASVGRMPHMAFTGIFGFDLYVRKNGRDVFLGSFVPPVDMQEGYESRLDLPAGGPWEITINFPLYNGVSKLLIGLKQGSLLEQPSEYRRPVPVVYYGSSITQGGCASRPGTSYQAIISRMLDCDFLNLGFSGSARGEESIADYMASLEMSAFVCDYDHNAPSVQHLADTHERLYRKIRAKHPDLPILLISKPDILWKEDDAEARRAVIRATYEKALSEGDRNVAFLDGARFFAGPMADDYTVDGSHPTDAGFMRMAQMIGEELQKRL